MGMRDGSNIGKMMRKWKRRIFQYVGMRNNIAQMTRGKYCRLNGWMDGERQGILGKAGDAVVWKDAKLCISQLVCGRRKEGTTK